jgi:hypothetical protein
MTTTPVAKIARHQFSAYVRLEQRVVAHRLKSHSGIEPAAALRERPGLTPGRDTTDARLSRANR